MQILDKIVQFSNSHFSQNEHFIQSYSSFVTQQHSVQYLQQSVSPFLSELLELEL
jgi:hemerythrin